jgi:hypothetical protein
MEQKLTLEEPGDTCILSVVFKARRPPSSWPTKTTDENPISEQKDINNSTYTMFTNL